MTTQDLVPWLRAQIAEKRRRAMATAFLPDGPAPAWTYDRHQLRVIVVQASDGYCVGVASRREGESPLGRYEDNVLDADGEHMELNDPQAAVAECDAHEAILKLHNVWAEVFPGDMVDIDPRDRHCIGCGFDALENVRTKDVNDCPTLRAVALAYQHQPGYLEEWRP